MTGILLAFPAQMFALNVFSDEDAVVYEQHFTYDDLLPQLRECENQTGKLDEIYVIGPEDYTVKIKELIANFYPHINILQQEF